VKSQIWCLSPPALKLRQAHCAFHSSFTGLGALLCNCLDTICGPHGRSGPWQDHACAAFAILHRDLAVVPAAAENDLVHHRMLQEVKHRVDSEDNELLHDLLVAQVHSTCQAHVPIHRPLNALLSATQCRHPCSAQQQGPPHLSPCAGWPAGGGLVEIHDSTSYHRPNPLDIVASPSSGTLASILIV
jgi:hypothetical protein